MCTKIPKNTIEERWRWVKPIAFERTMKLKDVAKVFPYSQRTLERWVADYKKYGRLGLKPLSTRPKSHPNETPIRIKEKILEIRRDEHFCAKKIKWQLENERIEISERVIGKIIKREGLTRKYRIRKIQYKYLRSPLDPGEMVEIDIKYVPQRLDKTRYYQFTAIDCATRWRYLKIYDNMGNGAAVAFVEKLLEVAPFTIRAIKTDNGTCFTNRYNGYLKTTTILPKQHSFDRICEERNIDHYLIDPGKPAQNGKVERSHRSDQESFYDRVTFKTPAELKYKIHLWNMYYNDLAHCGLNGKSPNQMLRLK
jgi:transposase InsO family protein